MGGVPTSDNALDNVVWHALQSRQSKLAQTESSGRAARFDPAVCLFGAVESRERLIELLDDVIGDQGACVALGDDLLESGLDHCALVAAPYGEGDKPLGVLGVIGPWRMDYRHVIPLVSYCSHFVTQKLSV